MNNDARIYVAGHQGLVGSALVERLSSSGFENLILLTRDELDLEDQDAVRHFFAEASPDYVFLSAAKVGGIQANDAYPADFFLQNIRIQTNVVDAAYREGAKKLLFLGSSCIYPRLAPQPISEDCLLTGELEKTNEAYAIAKIAGIKMCEAYKRQFNFSAISVMPTNLYGPRDNFDLESSHVLPALIRKFHEAREHGSDRVFIWGTGTPRREFLHVDDLADACFFLMKHYDDGQLVNVGWGDDISIASLAELVGEVVGYEGRLEFDRSKPDGSPRKLLDISKLRELGWEARIPLRSGIESTYRWYLENIA
ncbi:MAG: GDP-L-fucose synthase family protein [Candidatus Rariloculaceae bacterium]